MIDLGEIQGYWRELLDEARGANSGGPFPAQDVSSVNLPAGHPLLAVDANNQRHLLLPVPSGARISGDQISTGVQLLETEWREQEQRIRVVDIVCLKPHLNDLFDLIAVDVLNGVSEEQYRPDLVGRRVLSRWRELLSRDPGEVPDKATIIGLLGELIVLRRLAEVNGSALKSWTGPMGVRHDFAGRRNALEVKATLRRRGLTLTINGVEQLVPPPGTELHLVVVRFEEAPYDGQSIADLIGELARLGIDTVALLERTANIGFPLDVITKISELKFRLLEWRCYLVDASFPRIIPTSFAYGALPNGVVSLIYEIDLSAAPPHPLSQEQVDRLVNGFLGS